jgi:hypothetical protein
VISDPTKTGAARKLLRQGNCFHLVIADMGACVVFELSGSGFGRVVRSRNRGTDYGTVLMLLVRTSKDLQGRPPLVSRCIYFMGLFFHGGNTGSNLVGDANILKNFRECSAFRHGPIWST